MLNSVLCGLLCEMWRPHGKCAPLLIKVAEHGFQEPMPNSPLLLCHLSFRACFLQEERLTTEDFLAFWLRFVLLPWQQGWLQTRLKKRFSIGLFRKKSRR